MKNREFDATLKEGGFSRELSSLFPAFSGPKNTYALRELRDRYERMSHPAATAILKLLDTVIAFRSSTSPDFKTMRDQSFSDADLIHKLDDMAREFVNFKTLVNQQQPGSNEFRVLSDALDYCMESVENRIGQLKDADERLYRLCMQNINLLK